MWLFLRETSDDMSIQTRAARKDMPETNGDTNDQQQATGGQLQKSDGNSHIGGDLVAFCRSFFEAIL